MMRHFFRILCFTVVLGFFSLQSLTASEVSSVDLSAWAKLPIQYKGRMQPLKAVAIDAATTIHGRARVAGLSPEAFAIELLARPEVWYQAPVIRVDHLALKHEAGLSEEVHFFSLEQLTQNEALQKKFLEVRRKNERDEGLLPLDRKVQSLESAMAMMDAAMTGQLFRMVPPTATSGENWHTLHEMMGAHSQGSDVIEKFSDLLTAYTEGDPSRFREAMTALDGALRKINSDTFIAPWKIDLELFYYAVKPFRWAWVLYLLGGALLLLAAAIKKSRLWNGAGLAAFTAGFVLHSAGLLMRILILERPPVSNMFESVIFMAWAVSFLAVVFSVISRKVIYIQAASLVGALVLIWGSLMPFDASLDVLVPVLRSNYWLTIHVLTIVSSYGAFALASGVAHATLARYAIAPARVQAIKELTLVSYRALQVGVILLAAGTILGGVWANESWGRFWGWDPKETWALISLLGYLAILHGRYVGWFREFGLSMGAVVCFLLIVMTWYGVNFVLGKGLHSYGFGAGGGHWVTGFAVAEALFLLWAWLGHHAHIEERKKVDAKK